MNRKEIEYIKHCGEYFEFLTGGRGHSKTKQIIEQLQQENKRLKEIIAEVRERVEQVAAYPYADFDIETKEDSYQVSISKWLDNLLQILDKAGDIDEKKN